MALFYICGVISASMACVENAAHACQCRQQTKGHTARNHKKRKSNKIYLFSSNRKSVRSFVRLSSASNQTPFKNYLFVYAHTQHTRKTPHSKCCQLYSMCQVCPFFDENIIRKKTQLSSLYVIFGDMADATKFYLTYLRLNTQFTTK